MSRLLLRLIPPVAVMSLVVGLWYLVFRISLDHIVAVLARA
jgi:hypothetical protein